MSHKLRELTSRFQSLMGQRTYLIQQKSKLALERDQHEQWTKLNPEVLSVLEQMQTRVQQATVQQYEQLLTEAMRTVLPGSRGQVRLQVQLDRGRPSMNVLIEHDGEPENIVNGRGGSLSNVLSTALRFIVINKLPVRRFLALDEPDCWMSSERVVPFMEMVNELSQAANVQTLTVSHHQSVVRSLSRANVICLSETSNGRIVAETESRPDSENEVAVDSAEWAHVDTSMTEGIGIRSIRLVNVMSHLDTFIPLAPGANFIIGENDIGKSVIIAALQAILYNQSDDSLIRHRQAEARIELGLEEGMTLVWRRLRQAKSKGGQHQKVAYELVDDSGTVLESFWGAREVPLFAQELLGMSLLDDDMDVHIAHQKSPIFLLGPDTTASRRAGLLSIGNEMQRVRRMLDGYQEKRQQTRLRLKAIQKEIEAIDRALIVLRQLDLAESQLNKLRKATDGLAQKQSDLVQQEGIWNQVERALASLAALAPLKEQSLRLCETANINLDLSMSEIFFRWRVLHREHEALSKLEAVTLKPVADMTWDPEKAQQEAILFFRWQGLARINKAFAEWNPESSNTRAHQLTVQIEHSDGQELVSRLDDQLQLKDGLKAEHAKCQQELAAIRQQIEKAKEAWGDKCPTCGQLLPVKSKSDGEKVA